MQRPEHGNGRRRLPPCARFHGHSGMASTGQGTAFNARQRPEALAAETSVAIAVSFGERARTARRRLDASHQNDQGT